MAKKTDPKKFRLSFGGTRTKHHAPTKAQAMKDAAYWIDFGQTKVCVEKRLPSGRFADVGCMVRSGAGARKARWQKA